MEIVIAFIAAWIIKSVWEDKSADFHGSKAEVAKRINQAHPNWSKERRQAAVRNAQRRHGAGWVGYQLRHGWIPMFGDIADGFRAARIAHADWKANRPPEPDGWWQKVKGAWKSGWAGAKSAAASKAKAAASKVKDAATGDTSPKDAPDAPDATRTPDPADNGTKPYSPTPAPGPQPKPAGTGRTPENNPGGPMSGETGGYAGAQQFTDNVGQSLTQFEASVEQYEADIIAGGLGNDPAAMATLAQMREGLETAKAGAGGHQAALNSHEQGAEYAQTKGDAAAKTEWLGQG